MYTSLPDLCQGRQCCYPRQYMEWICPPLEEDISLSSMSIHHTDSPEKAIQNKRMPVHMLHNMKKHKIHAAVSRQWWRGHSGRARGMEGRAEEEEGQERIEGTPPPILREVTALVLGPGGNRCPIGFLLRPLVWTLA